MNTAIRALALAQELRELVEPVDEWQEPQVLALQWEGAVQDAMYDLDTIQEGNDLWDMCLQVAHDHCLDGHSGVWLVARAVMECADRLEEKYSLLQI